MEDPEARRERLKRLREQVQGVGGTDEKADEGLNPSLQFKNYRPRDDLIASKQVCSFGFDRTQLGVQAEQSAGSCRRKQLNQGNSTLQSQALWRK